MDLLVVVYLFVLGTIFGSFALAVVDRMHAKKDWGKGRSECDKCKKQLAPHDLIPVFSWVLSGGKCRYCKAKLSKTYPLSELSLGLSFSLSYIYWPNELIYNIEIFLLIVWLSSLVLLCMLLVYDLRWFTLPNKMVYPLIILSVLWAIFNVVAYKPDNPLLNYSSSLLVSSGVFAILFYISRGKWIGFGDVRLGVAIGFFAGTWQKAWLVIFLAAIIGLIFSLPAIMRSKKTKKLLKYRLPFGPMLIVALFIVVLWGQKIIDWYVTDILLL